MTIPPPEKQKALAKTNCLVIGFPDGENPQLIINGTDHDLANGAKLYIDRETTLETINTQAETIERLTSWNEELQRLCLEKDDEIAQIKAKLWIANDRGLRTYDGMAEKADRADKLQAELDQVIKIGVEGQREINRKLSVELAKCKADLTVAVEALKFYADRDNWTTETAQKCCAFTAGDHEYTGIYLGFKAGKLAREALAKIKEGAE
jgi:hypothetical protein